MRSSARSRSRTKRVRFIRLDPFLVSVTMILLNDKCVVSTHSVDLSKCAAIDLMSEESEKGS